MWFRSEIIIKNYKKMKMGLTQNESRCKKKISFLIFWWTWCFFWLFSSEKLPDNIDVVGVSCKHVYILIVVHHNMRRQHKSCNNRWWLNWKLSSFLLHVFWNVNRRRLINGKDKFFQMPSDDCNKTGKYIENY